MKKLLLLLSSFIFFTLTVFFCLHAPLMSDSFFSDALSFTAPGVSPEIKVLPTICPDLIYKQCIASASTIKKVSSPKPAAKSESKPLSYISDPVPSGIIETTISKGGTSLSGAEINNETDYDLAEALREVDISGSPTVLIVHTHASESYRPSFTYSYTPTDNSRTEDTDFNVVRVGKELATYLSSYGINVIHDSSLNDYPSYNGSYQKTLKLIESHLKKNPSIDMIIDLHRDAMERADGTKISTVCTIENEKAAQVMLVAGTDQSGLSHDNWRDNFSFAVKLQNIINSKFPYLARPINVRKERFNGHLSKKELIIEVGTTGNTLDEALVSARALASSINEFYKG